MRIKPMVKRGSILVAVLGVVLLCGFMVIQFVPVDQTNPPVVREPTWDSPQTRGLVERACFDCHSNETVWPWYSRIAPMSWMITRDVYEGREELNFSEWGMAEGEGGHEDEDDDADDDEEEDRERDEAREDESEAAEEMIETIREGEMPLPRYLMVHPEARLTEAEIEQLVKGLEATFGAEATLDLSPKRPMQQ
ncbi:MAG: heme-binding domain-containing protein [Nitrospira sp.]|nr:heme-binding domain-containing protein [Nitrospira sp.]